MTYSIKKGNNIMKEYLTAQIAMLQRTIKRLQSNEKRQHLVLEMQGKLEAYEDVLSQIEAEERIKAMYKDNPLIKEFIDTITE